MAVVYLAVRLIDQRTAPANAISLTAAVILLVHPLAVVDVGFWFTFGATMALVVAARSTKENADTKDNSLVRAWLRRGPLAILVGTAAIELALVPIGAFVFQRITLAGLLLNVIALPAMTVVQLASMAVVVADLCGLAMLAGWLGQAVHAASVALVESARLLDLAPWLTWRVPSPGGWLLALYYVSLCAALRWSAARTLVAVLFLWIAAAPNTRVRAAGDGRLHLSMLDVGQGDSLLVTFPNGRRLLVDAGGVPGGNFDIGDRVVGPALRARGVLALDYFAVTHGDADHAGGAPAILRDFSPREVWWGIPVHGHDLTDQVRDESRRQRAAWRTLQRGDRIEIGGVDVRVLHPPPQDWERQRIRNNDSLVLELRFGSVSVLLTGDIARDVEAELVPSLDLAATVVLKVAHHGSLTSSMHRFLETVHPVVALIGVGRGNSYGHPAPYVLGRLHDLGAEVFRTDLDGQVDVVTDGRAVWSESYTGRIHCAPFSAAATRAAIHRDFSACQSRSISSRLSSFSLLPRSVAARSMPSNRR
jgi:competence protein ComEC